MKQKLFIFAVLVAALVKLEAGGHATLLHSSVEGKALSEYVHNELGATPTPELAAASALVISKVESFKKQQAAIAALRFCFTRSKTVVPMVVAQISRKFPDLSLGIALEAVILSPSQSFEIAMAASSAAPKYAQEIRAVIYPNADNNSNEFVAYNKQIIEGSESITIAPKSQLNSTRRVASGSQSSTTPITGSGGTFKGTIKGTAGTSQPVAINPMLVTPGFDNKRAVYGRP